MPLCELQTNLPRTKVDESFAKELSKHVADIVGSTEKAVTIKINADQIMVRGGTTGPVAHMSVHSFSPQYFTDEMRVKLIQSLTSFISERLEITDKGRIIVSFHPIEATHVGMMGKLASELNV